MKTIKILTALFIALVAMSSCTMEDNPAPASPVNVNGIWYAEVPMTGITYDMRAGDELQTVTYDHVGIKLTLEDNIGGPTITWPTATW